MSATDGAPLKMQYGDEIKVAILGDKGSGRTSIKRTYIDNEFREDVREQGDEIRVVQTQGGSKRFKVTLFDPDIAVDGKGTVREFIYSRKPHVVLLCVRTDSKPVNDRTRDRVVGYWIPELYKAYQDARDMEVVLVGTCSDAVLAQNDPAAESFDELLEAARDAGITISISGCLVSAKANAAGLVQAVDQIIGRTRFPDGATFSEQRVGGDTQMVVASGMYRSIERIFAVFNQDRDAVLSVDQELPRLLAEAFNMDASPDVAKQIVRTLVEKLGPAGGAGDDNEEEERHPLAIPEGTEGAKSGMTGNGLLHQLRSIGSDNPEQLAAVLRRLNYVVSGPYGDDSPPPGYFVFPGCRADAETDAADDLEAARQAGVAGLPQALALRRYLMLLMPLLAMRPPRALPAIPDNELPPYYSKEAQALLSQGAQKGAGPGHRLDGFMELSEAGKEFLGACFREVQDEEGMVSRDYFASIFHRCPGMEDCFGVVDGEHAWWLPGQEEDEAEAAARAGMSAVQLRRVSARGGNLRFPCCVRYGMFEEEEGEGDRGEQWEISQAQWIAAWQLLACVAPKQALKGMYALGFSTSCSLDTACDDERLRPSDDVDRQMEDFEPLLKTRQSPRWAFRQANLRKAHRQTHRAWTRRMGGLLAMPSLSSGAKILQSRTDRDFAKVAGEARFPSSRRVFLVGSRGSGKSWLMHQHLHGASVATNPPPAGGVDNRPPAASSNPALAATISSAASDGGSTASPAEASSGIGAAGGLRDRDAAAVDEDEGEDGGEFGWETPVHYAVTQRVRVQQVHDSMAEQLGREDALRQQTEVNSRPRLLLVSEFPESLRGEVLRLAAAQADVLLVHADGRSERSVDFAIRCVEDAPDGVAVAVSYRGPPPSRVAEGSPLALLLRRMEELDVQAVRTETRKGASDMVGLCAGLSTMAFSESPMTAERTKRWAEEDRAADSGRQWARAGAATGLLVAVLAAAGAVGYFGFTESGKRQWEEGTKKAKRIGGLAVCEVAKAAVRVWRQVRQLLKLDGANAGAVGTGHSHATAGEAAAGGVRASSPMAGGGRGFGLAGLSASVLAAGGAAFRYGRGGVVPGAGGTGKHTECQLGPSEEEHARVDGRQ